MRPQHTNLGPRNTYQLTYHVDGYTLSTGVLSNEMQWGMASIPLADAPTMHVGYIMHDERKPSPLLQQYLDELNRIIHAN